MNRVLCDCCDCGCGAATGTRRCWHRRKLRRPLRREVRGHEGAWIERVVLICTGHWARLPGTGGEESEGGRRLISSSSCYFGGECCDCSSPLFLSRMVLYTVSGELSSEEIPPHEGKSPQLSTQPQTHHTWHQTIVWSSEWKINSVQIYFHFLIYEILYVIYDWSTTVFGLTGESLSDIVPKPQTYTETDLTKFSSWPAWWFLGGEL